MPYRKSILIDLRGRIIKGEYKPGEHITEALLSELYGTSRTPVREALNQLEKEGFVRIIPNAGARVADLSIEDISNIFDVLIALEAAASGLAATRLGEKEILQLEQIQFLMKKAVGENNLDLVSHLNTQFHWLITESTKNSYLIEIRDNSRRLLDYRVGQINVIVPGQIEATLQDHQRIIDAFKAQNPALAEYVTREHLEFAKKRLLKYLVKYLG